MTQEEIEQAAEAARRLADGLEQAISEEQIPCYVAISALVEVAIRIAEANGGSVLDVKHIVDDSLTGFGAMGDAN